MDVTRTELWCPGPSLVPHEPTTDWVVTVNRAALALWPWRHQCSHWGVVHDADTAIKLHATGEFVPDCVLTDAGSIFEVCAAMPRIFVYPHEWLRFKCGNLRFKYSKVEALALCHLMGAKEIVLHGDDMSGTLDWDGVRGGTYRTSERWQAEQRDTQQAVEFLASQGTSVIRVEGSVVHA